MQSLYSGCPRKLGRATWRPAPGRAPKKLRGTAARSALLLTYLLGVSSCGSVGKDPPSAETGGATNSAAQALVPICTTIQRGFSGTVRDTQIARTLGVSPVADGAANTNYGASPTAAVGTVGPKQFRKTLLGFDLSSISPTATVTSATVTLRTTSTGEGTVNVKRVTTLWAENVVTYNSWNNAQAINVEASFVSDPPAGGGLRSFDITPLAQSWINGTHANDGMVLIEEGSFSTTISTSEAANLADRPKLVICYSPPVVCGDGSVDGAEGCDDQNTASGDGCSSTCQIEPGFTCQGSPSSCGSCSDGTQNQSEIGVDCGGPCAACPTCSDGIQNQGEAAVDCGGPCPAACSVCGMAPFAIYTPLSAEVDQDNRVEVWHDLSGNGRDLVPPTPANAPLLIPGAVNNLPAVEFSGGQTLIAGGFPLSGAFTIVVVSKPAVAESARLFLLLKNHDQSDYFALYFPRGNPLWSLALERYQANQLPNNPLQAGNFIPGILDRWNYVTVTGSPNSNKAYLEKIERPLQYKDVGASPAGSPSTGMTVPSATQLELGYKSFVGQAAEIIVFPAVLSTPDRECVWQHVAAKYALGSEPTSGVLVTVPDPHLACGVPVGTTLEPQCRALNKTAMDVPTWLSLTDAQRQAYITAFNATGASYLFLASQFSYSYDLGYCANYCGPGTPDCLNKDCYFWYGCPCGVASCPYTGPGYKTICY